MCRKNGIVFLIFSLALAGSIVLFPSLTWPTLSYDDIYSLTIPQGEGTIEFNVRFSKDVSSDPHDHVLFLGASSDGSESYDIKIIKDTLIVRRSFGHCLLTAFSTPYNSNSGDWHSLKLSWNKGTTKFYLDDQEIKKIGPLSSDDMPKFSPCIRLGHEGNFKIDNLRISANSGFSEDPSDAEFVRKCSCPNLAELLNERPQEEYRGIQIQNFPDQKSRDTIKSYIALLPEDFATSIKHVVFISKERASGRGEAALADLPSMSIMIEEKYFDNNPNAFFHEAAHVYDFKLHIATGVPEEKNEWAAISGANCYFKGTDLKQFYEDFSKTHVKNGFLEGQGGECSPEDLAEWVGAVYEHYLKNTTLVEYLNPASPKYSEKNQKKLDFLLKKGFFSQEIYDKVTSR